MKIENKILKHCLYSGSTEMRSLLDALTLEKIGRAAGRTKPSRWGQSWSGETAKSILRNEVYDGHMVRNKTALHPTRTTSRSKNRRKNGFGGT